jgi:hypothetical protein
MVFVPPRDRVLEHSTSNSQTVFAVTGALDLSYNAFSASMAVNDTTLGAVVEAGVAFKAGILTYSATNQVTVTTALDSKGTFSSSGVKEVFMGLPAAAAQKGPTTQIFLSGSGSYATPNNCLWIEIEIVGGGGGGAGSGTSPGNGGGGNPSTFGTGPLINALGGGGGTGTAGGAPQTPTGGYYNAPGNAGQSASSVTSANPGGDGGTGPLGGAGKGGVSGAGAGQVGQANTGGGGGGGGVNLTPSGGGGGASGGYARAIINSPAASYAYAIGTGGTAGTAGTSGAAGGAGGSGIIIVKEYYS